MKFIDEIEITVKSGNGGPGKKNFRREKFVPRGGPDGGDGGAGGDVLFRANPRLLSLLDLGTKRQHAAEDGKPGEGQMMTGADGNNLLLEVPPGTMIKSKTTGELLLDLDVPEMEVVFLKGGRGGKGNAFFKTSVNQAPTHTQPGERGETLEIRLELKLLANVGIIGFPNVGKSTLISHISAARPKIADYPFTTLIPNLGVVKVGERSLVVADIPGLVPGAHAGVGLGIRFLKHIERSACFIHLVDVSGVSGRDPLDDYRQIQAELEEYDKLYGEDGTIPLSKRRQVVVLNKIDTLSAAEISEWQATFRINQIDTMPISAATGQGLTDLVFKIGEMVFGSN